MTVKLYRQNHTAPKFSELYSCLEGLNHFLDMDVDQQDECWLSDFNSIVDFQDKDGSFKLLDSFKVESDARVDFCYIPTYICTAIIMKAFMFDQYVLAGRESVLANALGACCGRGLSGHGYEWLEGRIKALNIFSKAGIREFLIYHADICPEFTAMMHELIKDLRAREAQNDMSGSWGEDYSEKICALNNFFSHSIAFVYGTLMAGENNHDCYLRDNTCIGKAEVSGFDMYDVGYYPAIIPGGGVVKGELYEITKADLDQLDYLEGEGSLYIRRCVPAKTAQGDIVFAHVYIYNHDTDGLYCIPERLQPYTANWKNRLSNYVWYVSYGSNMLKDRFMHYIKGGKFENRGRKRAACVDTSEPVAVRAYDIPFDMYFANESGSWEHKGVSFLDITKPGHALGVAYLISREQFEHVAREENGGGNPESCPNWYNCVKNLDSVDSCEVVTLTNDGVRPYNEPCEAYLNTLHRGLAENYPEMSYDEINQYLISCFR